MAIVDSDRLSVFPQSGWEYRSIIDLKAPVGTCAYCGTEIRYCHIIFHREWGTISVGALCADRLTRTETASRNEKELKRYQEKMERFLKSKRWKSRKNGTFFTLDGFQIRIWEHDDYCNLEIGYPVGKPAGRYQKYEYLKSRRRYDSVEAAKRKAFDVIVSGKFQQYLDSRKGAKPS